MLAWIRLIPAAAPREEGGDGEDGPTMAAHQPRHAAQQAPYGARILGIRHP